MASNNMCPDCKKGYSKSPTRCICGWYLTNEAGAAQVNSHCCQFVEIDGIQCTKTGSVSFRVKGSDWFCSEHVRQLREESYKR